MTLYDQVRNLLAQHRHAPAGTITPETAVLSDLGMDGDATDDFLKVYAARFDVDMSAFRLADHFGEDRFDPLFPVMLMMFKALSPMIRQRLHHAELRDITLYHLAICAERKIWTPPPTKLSRKRSVPGAIFDLVQAGISVAVLGILLFCVFVGAALTGFALLQWPELAVDAVNVIAGPFFLLLGIGYPLRSFRKTQEWISKRLSTGKRSTP